MGDSLRTLKGVGDKTEKLFFKLGIYDTDDLLHYYPRNYDAFEAPVDIADLEEGTVKAVSAAVCSGVYVTSAKGRQIITASINDSSGKLQSYGSICISSNCVEARQSVCLPWTNRTKAVPP